MEFPVDFLSLGRGSVMDRVKKFCEVNGALEIIGYSDSDFAGCRDSMKSTSCYIYLLEVLYL